MMSMEVGALQKGASESPAGEKPQLGTLTNTTLPCISPPTRTTPLFS